MNRKGIVIGELLVTLVFVVLVIGVGIFIVYKFMKTGTESVDNFQQCEGLIGTFAGAEGRCTPTCPPEKTAPREGYRWQSFGNIGCSTGVCCLLVPGDSTASAEEMKKASDLAMCQNIQSGTMVVKVDGSCQDLNAYRTIVELDKQLEIIYYLSSAAMSDISSKKSTCTFGYTIKKQNYDPATRRITGTTALADMKDQPCQVASDGQVRIYSGTLMNGIQGVTKDALLREIGASGKPVSATFKITVGGQPVERLLQAGQPSNGGTSSDAVCRTVSPQGTFDLDGWDDHEESMNHAVRLCTGVKPNCYWRVSDIGLRYAENTNDWFVCKSVPSDSAACAAVFADDKKTLDSLATRQC